MKPALKAWTPCSHSDMCCFCYVQACPVPRMCQHAPQRPEHSCHYGPCPPCNHPCGITQVCSPLACRDACLTAAGRQPSLPSF